LSASKSDEVIQIITSPSALADSWDEYVLRQANSAIFHSKNWQCVLQDSYPYRFFGIQALDASGKIIGVLPAWLVASKLTGKRLVSSPFSYICEPLADNDEIAGLMLQRAREICQGESAAYYELKSLHRVSAADQLFVESGQFDTYLLDLKSSEDELLAGTHKNMIQRGIAKAQKEGVEIRVGNEEACVEELQRLNLLTCRKHGIPAQPLIFLRQVWLRLVLNGGADILFAYYKDMAIGSMVIFYYKSTATYMYGASDEQHLAQRPNHLLLWEAILRAKQRGMVTFDLGRVSDDNPGLKEFKQRWGAGAVPLHYYYWPEKKGVGAVNRKSLKFRLTTLMFSKMPIAVTARLTWLYKHLA
jgi:hypothetical protein